MKERAAYLNEEHKNNEIILLDFVVSHCFSVIVELLALVNKLDRIAILRLFSCNAILKLSDLQSPRMRMEGEVDGQVTAVLVTVVVSSIVRSKKSVPLSVLMLTFIALSFCSSLCSFRIS